MSLELAESVHFWAGWALVASLVIGVIATWAHISTSAVKEEYLAVDLARMHERAASAELEAQRLRQSMAWRRVSPEQRSALVSALTGHDITVWTAWVGDDPEATLFRNEVDAALLAAGVKTRYFRGVEMSLGFSLSGPDGEQRDMLEQAFRSAGLPFDRVETRAAGQNGGLSGLVIIVGTKPEPAP